MIILGPDAIAAFTEYRASLKQLEDAFNLAGLPITFTCILDDSNQKVVEVSKQTHNTIRYIYIEGDSPAQAIKDVAKGVRL